MKFKPLFDRILIKVKPVDKTKGGILLPDRTEIYLTTGTILDMGPGPLMSNGATVPMPFNIGDEIVFNSDAVQSIEIEGEKFDTLTVKHALGLVERDEEESPESV